MTNYILCFEFEDTIVGGKLRRITRSNVPRKLLAPFDENSAIVPFEDEFSIQYFAFIFPPHLQLDFITNPRATHLIPGNLFLGSLYLDYITRHLVQLELLF